MKAMLWFVSTDKSYFLSAKNILERQLDGFEFVGVTAVQEDETNKATKQVLPPLPFIPLNQVFSVGYDILLAVGAKKIGMNKVVETAHQLKLPEEKILGDWIVCIPGFTLEKYRQLQQSCLSIFSMNCFGGLLSHLLGLPLRSPFFNLYLNPQDFIRFLTAPHKYMEENLIFNETRYDSNVKHDFPVVSLGDVNLYMNHYPNFESARTEWERRKTRINWNNLFVTAYTENEDFLQQFAELPYSKKACFVPFKSYLDSAWFINVKPCSNLPWWKIVNDYANGSVFYYDLFDMLLYGKKTPLIEI